MRAALPALRAVVPALRAVLRAELAVRLADAPVDLRARVAAAFLAAWLRFADVRPERELPERDELLERDELPERDELRDELEREVLREPLLLDDELERRRVDRRRVPPLRRSAAGTSSRTTWVTSLFSSRWRKDCIRSSSRRNCLASFAVSLSLSFSATPSMTL